jgi:hypothetical protein
LQGSRGIRRAHSAGARLVRAGNMLRRRLEKGWPAICSI